MTPRARIARHEAGHAVMMLRFALPFGVACIYTEPTNGYGGHVGTDDAPLPPLADRPAPQRNHWADALRDAGLAPLVRVRFVRLAIVDAAGVAAEFPVTRAWARAHDVSSTGDRRNFEARCIEWGVRASWPWFHHQAIGEVDREWAAIEAVAEALDAHGVLEFGEVAEIVATAPHRANAHRERPWELLPLDVT